MSEQKSRFEQMLELLVYAPVGIAVTASEELPKLIEKGRTRITGQVTMARMMGQFAVQQGQQQAEKLVKDATERLNDLGVVPGSRPASPPPTAPAPAAASGGTPARHEHEQPAKAAAEPPAEKPSSNGSRSSAAADLAIPGYDSLSASQVVQRLGGLSGEELEAVRVYESSNRGRKTILSRVAQLQSGSV